MTSQVMAHEIAILFDSMRELTIESGVSETLYNKAMSLDGSVTTYHLKERLEFLEGVKTAEYKELEAVWNLLPRSVWSMYKCFGLQNLPEQVLLRKARKRLKKVWEKRYEVKRDDTQSKEA